MNEAKCDGRIEAYVVVKIVWNNKNWTMGNGEGAMLGIQSAIDYIIQPWTNNVMETMEH